MFATAARHPPARTSRCRSGTGLRRTLPAPTTKIAAAAEYFIVFDTIPIRALMDVPPSPRAASPVFPPRVVDLTHFLGRHDPAPRPRLVGGRQIAKVEAAAR